MDVSGDYGIHIDFCSRSCRRYTKSKRKENSEITGNSRSFIPDLYCNRLCIDGIYKKSGSTETLQSGDFLVVESGKSGKQRDVERKPSELYPAIPGGCTAAIYAWKESQMVAGVALRYNLILWD